MWRVVQLFVHPVKSCGAVAVDAVELDRRGFVDDRRWMVVDGAGRFVTQREHPEMTAVRVAPSAGGYVLTHDGLPSLTLPSVGLRRPGDDRRRDVVIWKDTVAAAVFDEGSRWMSLALGFACELVRLADDVRRAVNPLRAAPGDEVGFADGYSVLLVGQSSLDDLAARAGIAIDARRFRPNIVVAGAPPWDEDRWAHLRVGPVAFRALKPCDRCSIPGLDPDSGERTKEPLATLATFRKKDQAVWLGINLAHDGLGRIQLGDPVTIDVWQTSLFDS